MKQKDELRDTNGTVHPSSSVHLHRLIKAMPPTKKTVSLRELRVGLLVLGSIAILIFLILNASGDINPFSKKAALEGALRRCEWLA